MKISLIINFEKQNSKSISLKIIKLLREKNVDVCTTAETAAMLRIDGLEIADNIFYCCDMVLVIGGDGTIIHTSKKAAEYDKPILGINSGRIGYLATLDQSELHKITEIIDGEYTIDKRIMLDVSVLSKDSESRYTAFNDAVVCKGAISRMIDIDISLDSHQLRYRADGLIISTPTGSSAYSLSAGGPLLDARLDTVLLTPICPYAYTNKSMVIPSYTDISIKVDTDSSKDAFLTVDGEVAVKIAKNDEIKISKSKTTVNLIRVSSESIYNRFENK